MSKSKTTIAQVTEWFLRWVQSFPNTRALDCSICDKPLLPGQRVDWDHCHPEGLNGPHEIGNLHPLHHDCHKAKSAKDVHAIAKTKPTRTDKFVPKKLPLDAPRPEKPRFGFRR